MDRITEKDGEFYKLKPENEEYGWENGIRLVQIVGQYKDSKEEIGFPLEVVNKALKNGIYNGIPEYIKSVGFVYMPNLYGYMLTCFNEKGEQTGCYPTKEYKKTWWLKKDKSE